MLCYMHTYIHTYADSSGEVFMLCYMHTYIHTYADSSGEVFMLCYMHAYIHMQIVLGRYHSAALTGQCSADRFSGGLCYPIPSSGDTVGLSLLGSIRGDLTSSGCVLKMYAYAYMYLHTAYRNGIRANASIAYILEEIVLCRCPRFWFIHACMYVCMYVFMYVINSHI
jgi:hypothetical protein